MILCALNITRSEKLEDIKVVIRRRTSKNRQNNDQKIKSKKDKQRATKPKTTDTRNTRTKLQNCRKNTNSHSFDVIAHMKEQKSENEKNQH